MTRYFGFRRTRITESPLRNILLMNLSLLMGFDAVLPFPVFGIFGRRSEARGQTRGKERERGRERERVSQSVGRLDWSLARARASPRARAAHLRPHLLHALQDHVEVSVEGLHPRQELPVVPAAHENLRVRLHGRREKGERSRLELLFLLLLELLQVHWRRHRVVVVGGWVVAKPEASPLDFSGNL